MNGFRLFVPEVEDGTPEVVTLCLYNVTPAELDMLRRMSETGVLNTLKDLLPVPEPAPTVDLLEDEAITNCRQFVIEYLQQNPEPDDFLLINMFKVCSSQRNEPGSLARFKKFLAVEATPEDRRGLYDTWAKKLGLLAE